MSEKVDNDEEGSNNNKKGHMEKKRRIKNIFTFYLVKCEKIVKKGGK
jgi:hypothetical protein